MEIPFDANSIIEMPNNNLDAGNVRTDNCNVCAYIQSWNP